MLPSDDGKGITVKDRQESAATIGHFLAETLTLQPSDSMPSVQWRKGRPDVVILLTANVRVTSLQDIVK